MLAKGSREKERKRERERLTSPSGRIPHNLCMMATESARERQTGVLGFGGPVDNSRTTGNRTGVHLEGGDSCDTTLSYYHQSRADTNTGGGCPSSLDAGPKAGCVQDSGALWRLCAAALGACCGGVRSGLAEGGVSLL